MHTLADAPLPELRTKHLRLRELAAADVEPLAAALWDPETWVVRIRGVNTPERLRDYLSGFLGMREAGTHRPLVAIDAAGGAHVALSVFHNATPGLKKVEIGYTWIATPWQRTHVNTEMKLAMLRHAFEAWGALRVEFYVDPRNEKSNRAMLRIGSVLEGCFRKIRFLNASDAGNRNVYSILDDEWPTVRAGLERSPGK